MSRSTYTNYYWLLVILIPPLLGFILMQETAFRFEHKMYLWGVCAVGPMVLLFIMYHIWREHRLENFAKPALIDRLIGDSSFNKHIVKFIFLSLAFEFIIIAFANPQIGTKQEKVKRQGIDVIVALDVSNSMLSEDIKPNRLARAKNFISHFIDSLENDRLGMVVFAGKAYLQMPLTVDYGAGKMYLKSVGPAMVPTQGTDVAAAINLAREGFVKEDKSHKALIIITDGEDNEGAVDEAIADAVKEGIKIFTIGVGSDNGSPIPMAGDYKRDESGGIVLSKLNQSMLSDIAAKGNGKYFQLGSGKDEISSIFSELGRINKREYEEYAFTDYDSQFQWSLAIAALLLVIEWWISEKKWKWRF